MGQARYDGGTRAAAPASRAVPGADSGRPTTAWPDGTRRGKDDGGIHRINLPWLGMVKIPPIKGMVYKLLG